MISKNRITGLVGLIAMLSSAAAVAGCLVIVKADPERTAAVGDARSATDGATDADAPAIVWPERWGDSKNGKGVVVPFRGPRSAWRGVTLGRFHTLRAEEPDLEDVAALAVGRVGPEGWSYRLEGPRSFVFRKIRDRDLAPEGADPGDGPIAFYRFVSGTEVDAPGSDDSVEVTRSWFALFPQAEGAEYRGALVLMPGLYGVPDIVISSLATQFRRDGWAVLRMFSPNSRFTERARIEIDDENPADGLDEAARISAERAAEQAYAVNAVLERARADHPELFEGDLIGMGMSAGAMTFAPTAAWIEQEQGLRFDAVILIGGGANWLAITELSSYAPWIDAIDLVWNGDDDARPVPDDLRAEGRLGSAYLERSPLDPHWTASVLRDTPVLMLHGTKDRAVPAFTGDLLWERLGRPERWSIAVDHDLLFLGLWSWGPRMVSWVDDTLTADADSDGEDRK